MPLEWCAVSVRGGGIVRGGWPPVPWAQASPRGCGCHNTWPALSGRQAHSQREGRPNLIKVFTANGLVVCGGQECWKALMSPLLLARATAESEALDLNSREEGAFQK